MALPKTVPIIFGKRVTKRSIITIEKCLSAKQDIRVKRSDHHPEQQSESPRSEPLRNGWSATDGRRNRLNFLTVKCGSDVHDEMASGSGLVKNFVLNQSSRTMVLS